LGKKQSPCRLQAAERNSASSEKLVGELAFRACHFLSICSRAQDGEEGGGIFGRRFPSTVFSKEYSVIQPQQTYFLDLYRSGMRATSDIVRASLENAQRMQTEQAEAVRTALDESAKAARELSEVKSLDEMLSVQTRVLGSQLQRAAEVWGRLWRTASESQMAMIGQVQNQVGQMGDTVRQSYAAQAGNAANAARDIERKAERKSA
jgi:hypothetical protein